jgi:hypothetical protein
MADPGLDLFAALCGALLCVVANSERRGWTEPLGHNKDCARVTHSRTLHPQVTVPLGAREIRDANGT